MHAIIPLLLMLLVILFFICVVYIGAVYPIWMGIRCITSSFLDRKTKAIWSILMLLTWPLGAVFYGLFFCAKKLVF